MKPNFTNPYHTATAKLRNDIAWVGGNFLPHSTDRFWDHSQYFSTKIASRYLKPVLLEAIARLDAAEKLETEQQKQPHPT